MTGENTAFLGRASVVSENPFFLSFFLLDGSLSDFVGCIVDF